MRYLLLFADVRCRAVAEKSTCVFEAFQAMFDVQHINVGGSGSKKPQAGPELLSFHSPFAFKSPSHVSSWQGWQADRTELLS